MASKEIKCHVETCKYNDSNRTCTLDDIVVGNSEGMAHVKKDTECDSFSEN
jgi:hypothetical protein